MNYRDTRRAKAIDSLKAIKGIDISKIDGDYVNSTTKINYLCHLCGALIQVYPSNLLARRVIGCGKCHRIKLSNANTKWRSPKWFQGRFLSIKQRIESPKSKHYKNYGGRGIKLKFNTVDEMWDYMSNLSCFNPKMTIDRINNDGNYEKGNLRWATSFVQNNNQRETGLGVRRVNNSPRYQARITVNSKGIYLGTFGTYELAREAVTKANEAKNNGYK